MSYDRQQVDVIANQSEQLKELKSAALEAVADAVAITDRDGVIEWVNTAFEQLTGYSSQDAIGQRARLLKSGVHPPYFYKNMWETILGGLQWQGELMNRRKDGTIYSEEMAITPIRNHAGEIAHFVAIKRDISQRQKVEQRLQMLAQAADNSSELMAMTDAGFRITWANHALLRALRYSEEKELLGKSVKTIMSPNNPPELFSEIAAQTLEHGVWRGECLHLRADGSDLPILLSAGVVKDQADGIVGTLNIAQDVTERKRAEREILSKTALLEGQAEATIDGILAVDETNKIILSNQRYAEMWGIPSEMLRAGDDEQLIQYETNQIENPRQFLDRIEHLINHKEEKSSDEIRLKDGRVLDRYSAPLVDSSGTYRGRIWYFRDITASKQAEEKVRASEELFRQLADNIHEVFFVVTLEPARLAYLSPAYEEIWGRPRQEVYERPSAWIESVHPDDREGVGIFFAQLVQGTQSKMSYRIVRPDGSVRWIEERRFPVRDDKGKIIRVVGTAEDTTVRRETHEKLKVALEELKAQADGAAKLAELVDILQSCQNAEEAFDITGNVLQDILQPTSGALFITSPSRDIVELATSWGDALATEKVFRPDDCWALRRGKVHQVKDSGSPLRCAHVRKSLSNGYLCVPLAAQGETLGVLYVENLSDAPGYIRQAGVNRAQVLERQATALGERISLALANLRLREVLRGQSIRDPLTGLFNRRFMEESLERELRRAVRGKQQLALLMLDIDHFKHFNDTFGHQAGDTLLRALGNLLKETTRGQDIVCRYGGEEFAFVLASASLDAARKRAERLREEVKQLNVRHGGQLLGAVTLSIGIAVFPDNGESPEHLMKAADEALYRAKEEGRDRVISA